MIPYIVLVCIPIIGTIVSLSNEKMFAHTKWQAVIISSFFSAWFLLLALRHFSVGTDIKGYITRFGSVSKMSFAEIFQNFSGEYGFWVLNKLISLISTNEQFYLAIMALVCILPLWYLYAKECDSALVAIVLFLVLLFTMYFSGLRQCIAMGFVVPAYYFTKKKKIIPFILMVVLGSLFHISAWVMLVIYPIYHVRLNSVGLILFWVVVLFVFIFRTQIFLMVLELFGDEYSKYVDWTGDTGAYGMLLLFVIFTAYAFLIPDNSLVDKDVLGLRNILLLSLLLQGFATINMVVMRINYYYLILLPVLISKIPSRARACDKWLADLSIVVMAFAFLIIFFRNAYLGEDILNVFPYIPFWGK